METSNRHWNVNAYRSEGNPVIKVGVKKPQGAEGYMNSGMYQQVMSSRKLLNLFDSHVDKYFNPDKEKESENEGKEVEESKTDTDIVVKPDGSRVLVVTTNIAGMSTTMSLKISEPTKLPNESGQSDETEGNNQDYVSESVNQIKAEDASKMMPNEV